MQPATPSEQHKQDKASWVLSSDDVAVKTAVSVLEIYSCIQLLIAWSKGQKTSLCTGAWT